MMMKRGVLALALAALANTAAADNTCVAMSIADYGVVTIELADDQVCAPTDTSCVVVCLRGLG